MQRRMIRAKSSPDERTAERLDLFALAVSLSAAALIRAVTPTIVLLATTLGVSVPTTPAFANATIATEVRTSAGEPVADAVVYAMPVASGTPAGAAPKAALRAAIEQVDREFIPYVSVVQTGTTITFPNRDPIRHHVYSFSRAKTFEIKLYSGEAPAAILFDQPGVVTLGCNIHDWMIAYVLVVDTPYFGKTNADGAAQLRNLPPGKYEIVTWHPTQKQAAPAQTVTLASGDARQRFTLDFAARKQRYKPPLDKTHY
jgi:plastocyanin